MKERCDYIDLTKIIAVLLIVISHQNILPQRLNMILCSFYIVVFYICSGMTFNKTHIHEKKYLFNYILNLLKYYFFYSFALLLAFNLYSLVTHTFSFNSFTNGLLGIFYSRYYILNSDNVLLNCSNAPMWFLTSYIVTYSMYYELRKKKYFNISNYLWIVILILFSFALSYIPFLLPWSLDTSFYFLSFIIVGDIISENNLINRINVFVYFIFIGLFIFLSFLNNSPINLSIKIYGDYLFLTFILGLLGSIVLIKSCYYIEKISKRIFNGRITEYLRTLGKNGGTLHIMCYHLSVLFVINLIIKNKVIAIIIVLICILLINNIVKKIYNKIIK